MKICKAEISMSGFEKCKNGMKLISHIASMYYENKKCYDKSRECVVISGNDVFFPLRESIYDAMHLDVSLRLKKKNGKYSFYSEAGRLISGYDVFIERDGSCVAFIEITNIMHRLLKLCETWIEFEMILIGSVNGFKSTMDVVFEEGRTHAEDSIRKT